MARLQRMFVGMILLGVVTSASSSMAVTAVATLTRTFSRTFVSAQTGSDGNPCTPTSPCRTFARAVAVTSAGGEVTVLDSGGYGPFTINQSIQIEAPAGVYAGLASTAGDGITVNAPGAVVVLRGLTIDGIDASGSQSQFKGITISSVGSLYVENCVITGGKYGVYNNADYATGVRGLLSVKDSVIRDTFTTGIYLLTTGAGSAAVIVDHVRLEADSEGLDNSVGSTANVTVRDSVVTGNQNYGVIARANSYPSIPGRVTVENSAIVNNKSGLATSTGAQIFASNNVISGNQIGLDGNSAGAITSYGDNRITGANNSDGLFNFTLGTQ